MVINDDNYWHELGGLKQQKPIVSQLEMLEV